MKLIGIVGRCYYNRDNQEIIQLNDALRQVLANYNDVTSILLLPINKESYLELGMSNDKIDEFDKEKLDYILDKCDGFIVPGGTYWYNFDEYIIKYAIDKKKPLLAICAGFQALCSMYALDRDKFDMTKRLEESSHYGKQDEYIHECFIKENTLLSNIINKEKIMVNSIHHDYVDFLMNELIVSASSSDNIIEAVELPNHPFLIGLQWHPEYLIDDNSIKIFDEFIKSVNQ